MAIAQTIAVTSREDIQGKQYGTLKDYFAELVRQPDVRSIVLMMPDGRVVVSTDASLAGRKFDDPATRKALAANDTLVQEVPGRDNGVAQVFDIAVPVMAYTRKAAIVRIEVSYGRVSEMF